MEVKVMFVGMRCWKAFSPRSGVSTSFTNALSVCALAEFTPAKIHRVQDHLQMKLVLWCREKGVGFASVYNIDESLHQHPSAFGHCILPSNEGPYKDVSGPYKEVLDTCNCWTNPGPDR
eukprot:4375212-Amphidinium_carterae.3